MHNYEKREVKSLNEAPLELGRVGATEQKQEYDWTYLWSMMTVRCLTKTEVADVDWTGYSRKVRS